MFSLQKLIDFLSVWVLFCKPAKMTVNKVSPDPLFKTVPGNRNRLITHTRWQQEPKIYHFNYHLLRNHLRCVYKVRGGGGGRAGVNAINLRPGRVYISHIRRNFWAFTPLSLSAPSRARMLYATHVTYSARDTSKGWFHAPTPELFFNNISCCIYKRVSNISCDFRSC